MNATRPPDSDAPSIFEARVSVRDLASFVHRTGDLGVGGASSVSAAEGIEGHRWLQSKRRDGFRPEVPLSRSATAGDVALEVAGRADGVIEGTELTAVEEIKTVAAPLVLAPQDGNPIHWAQATLYAAMLSSLNDLDEVEVRLAYLHFESRQVRTLRRLMKREELEAFWEETTGSYLEWLVGVLEHRRRRDESASALTFPHDSARAGQEDLILACRDAMRGGQKLFAQAPTGSGKTIALTFGAVKAMAEGNPSQIFFLTSRTTGRVAAAEAFGLMMDAGLVSAVLSVTARDKICPHPGTRCVTPDCPLAEGHNDRIRAAIEEAFEAGSIDAGRISAVASRHRVCPFELSMELIPWVDAVICDVNYVFDPAVSPKVAQTEILGPRGYLVDEAHNLVDRAREMFSVELKSKVARKAAKAAGKHSPLLRKAAAGLADEIVAFADSTLEDGARHGLADRPGTALISRTEELLETAVPLLSEIPALGASGDFMALFFSCLAFTRLIRGPSDGHSVITTAGRKDRRLELYCVDPSRHLEAALKEPRAAVFFSATLTPMSYFTRILCGQARPTTLVIPPAFPAENLLVLGAPHISVRYRDRRGSLEGIVEMIGALARSKPGNHMVYLPSYQYLEAVAGRFEASFPDTQVVRQWAGMSDAEREEFLSIFQESGPGTRVGFAVLGGAFAEGIDLAGDRLIGAAVVTVGLPKVGPHRELIRARFDEEGKDGFAFAYTYPGLNKVLQAAGRVIRGPEDRGVVMLLDNRFAQHPYRDLLPGEWEPISWTADGKSARRLLEAFWDEKNPVPEHR